MSGLRNRSASHRMSSARVRPFATPLTGPSVSVGIRRRRQTVAVARQLGPSVNLLGNLRELGGRLELADGELDWTGEAAVRRANHGEAEAREVLLEQHHVTGAPVAGKGLAGVGRTRKALVRRGRVRIAVLQVVAAVPIDCACRRIRERPGTQCPLDERAEACRDAMPAGVEAVVAPPRRALAAQASLDQVGRVAPRPCRPAGKPLPCPGAVPVLVAHVGLERRGPGDVSIGAAPFAHDDRLLRAQAGEAEVRVEVDGAATRPAAVDVCRVDRVRQRRAAGLHGERAQVEPPVPAAHEHDRSRVHPVDGIF